ncbi:MAG: hypothetical protein P8179_17430 [Candidatus Thiodiazotropha sp.]|jgi:hypothetical protein
MFAQNTKIAAYKEGNFLFNSSEQENIQFKYYLNIYILVAALRVKYLTLLYSAGMHTRFIHAHPADATNLVSILLPSLTSRSVCNTSTFAIKSKIPLQSATFSFPARGSGTEISPRITHGLHFLINLAF